MGREEQISVDEVREETGNIHPSTTGPTTHARQKCGVLHVRGSTGDRMTFVGGPEGVWETS